MRKLAHSVSPLKIKRVDLLPSFKICFFILLVLVSTKSIAQFPAASSCTSKDLALVRAVLPVNPGENACTCGGTRTLNLYIYNKTGSTRTSFAFWGTLKIYNSDGTLASSTPIKFCGGPIAKNDTTKLLANQITFTCGQALSITNLFLAWTDASPGSTCPLDSSKIAPKCGTLDSIKIEAGVALSATPTGASCAGNDGSISVSPSGGKSNYSVACTGKTTQTNIAPGGSASFTGLTPGAYTITVTDANTCTVTSSQTITSSSIPAPAATVTQPTCATATGTVTVTSPDANTTYTLEKNNVVIKTAVSGVFSSVSPDTYVLKATKGGCTNTGSNVVVNAQPLSPSFTVCLVQPTLCGNTGSVHVNTPTGGSAPFTYKLNSGSTQTTKDFTGLGSSSVTSITVANNEGCSTTVLCGNLVESCPGTITQASPTSELTESGTTVKAYPNPFSDRIKFVVTSPVAGRGNLEVYNMMGQKVKTVYQGFIASGTQTFELSLPTQQIANLVYVLRIGDKKMTGKILQINR